MSEECAHEREHPPVHDGDDLLELGAFDEAVERLEEVDLAVEEDDRARRRLVGRQRRQLVAQVSVQMSQ